MSPVQDELSVSLAWIQLLETPLELFHAELGFFQFAAELVDLLGGGVGRRGRS
jgi:hypothetical protein